MWFQKEIKYRCKGRETKKLIPYNARYEILSILENAEGDSGKERIENILSEYVSLKEYSWGTRKTDELTISFFIRRKYNRKD